MALVILYCFNLFGPLPESDKETRFLEKFIRHLPIDSTVLGSFQMRIHAHNVCFMSYFNRSGPIFLNFDARDEILAIYFEFRDANGPPFCFKTMRPLNSHADLLFDFLVSQV